MVVLVTTFEKNIQNFNIENKGIKLKSKRDEISTDCKYVNSLLEKDESYNCCDDDRITCENGFITKM